LWEILGKIAEHIGFSLSVIGLCGLAWYVASAIIEKLIKKE